MKSEVKNTTNDDEDFDVDVDSESLDEQSLAVAIKGDPGNQANLMITNLYKMNTSSGQQATRTSPIHLAGATALATTTLAPSSVPSTSRSLDKVNITTMAKKEVRFDTNGLNETRKRKPSIDVDSSFSSNNNAKSSRSDTTIQNGSDRFSKSDANSDISKARKSPGKRCKLDNINILI